MDTSRKPNLLPAHGEDTIGPYYPPKFFDGDRNDLTRLHPTLPARPRGAPIVLTGRVLDVNGKPVDALTVEFWQANADGKFRAPNNQEDASLDPYFDGYARHYAADGQYRLRTIKPGAVKADRVGEVRRAPHVTVTLFCDGISRVVTQIFFADEPDNARDPLLASLPPELRMRLIAHRDGKDGDAARYVRDIVMRGDQETPFFDDLES